LTRLKKKLISFALSFPLLLDKRRVRVELMKAELTTTFILRSAFQTPSRPSSYPRGRDKATKFRKRI